MRSHRALFALAGVASLLLGAPLVLADDAAPPGPPPHMSKREFCKENPEKCEQRKQRHAERREWCQQNPEPCEQQRAEWKQRRAELKATCASDPVQCEEMKQQMRERRQQRRGTPADPAQ